jgi:hypothetical protein
VKSRGWPLPPRQGTEGGRPAGGAGGGGGAPEGCRLTLGDQHRGAPTPDQGSGRDPLSPEQQEVLRSPDRRGGRRHVPHLGGYRPGGPDRVPPTPQHQGLALHLQEGRPRELPELAPVDPVGGARRQPDQLAGGRGERCARPTEVEKEEEGGEGDGEDLGRELEALDQGDAAHPASGDGGHHHHGHHRHPHPVGEAGSGLHREAGGLHLGEGVEEADHQDQDHRQTAEPGAVETALGEVRDGVGAEATQGSGHEQQEQEVPGRVAHGVPEHVVPELHHQAGHPEEGGGAQILAADGGGVYPRGHGAGRHHEVGGGAAVAAGEEAGEDADQRHRHQAEHRRHRRGHPSASAKEVGELLIHLLGPAHVVAPQPH